MRFQHHVDCERAGGLRAAFIGGMIASAAVDAGQQR
jgi:hypothetical protein